MIRILSFSLFAACLFLGLHNSALAATKNIDVIVTHGVPTATCSNLQSNTQYFLTADITPNGCLFPSSSTNITLDCNGHIIATTGKNITAVNIQGVNNTVTNCNISTTNAFPVIMAGTGHTLTNSTVTAATLTIVTIEGKNMKVTNNILSDPTLPYALDDDIVIINSDNVLIDNNTIFLGNFDLAIEGVGYITNSQISNNTIYVSGSGNGAIGGWYGQTGTDYGNFQISGTKITGNRIHGTPWFRFNAWGSSATYTGSVDADATAALDHNNIFSGNTTF